MIEIDHHTAIKTLRECVAERGADFVYKSPEEMTGTCMYWHRRYIPDQFDEWVQDEDDEGEPGCLIGLMLHKLGVPPEAIRAHEQCSVSNMADSSAFRLTPSAIGLCQNAQSLQDKDYTWGDALKAAEDEYKYLTTKGEQE